MSDKLSPTLPPPVIDDAEMFAWNPILGIDVKDNGDSSDMKFDFPQLVTYVGKVNGAAPQLPEMLHEQQLIFDRMDTTMMGM